MDALCDRITSGQSAQIRSSTIKKIKMLATRNNRDWVIVLSDGNGSARFLRPI
jgi:hypothetical protein